MCRILFLSIAWAVTTAAAPVWMDDRFELPAGFHIFRAAAPQLSGGSYALTVDGEGRLLVGDGTAVRRLIDDDGDGVFDRFEILATGLGPRGPQGLLVDGDTLSAVGGDGLQRFTGYRSGRSLHAQGRLGNPLRTGGDHDAHCARTSPEVAGHSPAAPGYAGLATSFLTILAKDGETDIRAQAAWLFGLRGGADSVEPLRGLLSDRDPFVRRRAAEALTRCATAADAGLLIDHLNDPERLIKYVAMNALAHRPTREWFADASARPAPQARLPALVAASLRRDLPGEIETRQTIRALLDGNLAGKEDRLDLLRVLSLFREVIQSDPELSERVQNGLRAQFPDPDREIRWEQARLLGDYRVSRAFPALLSALEHESDRVTQFHLAQNLSALVRAVVSGLVRERAQLQKFLAGARP